MWIVLQYSKSGSSDSDTFTICCFRNSLAHSTRWVCKKTSKQQVEGSEIYPLDQHNFTTRRKQETRAINLLLQDIFLDTNEENNTNIAHCSTTTRHLLVWVFYSMRSILKAFLDFISQWDNSLNIKSLF